MYMYTYMYMGKNYTLYIRLDKFATESNKGGLVNELLERHYGSPGRAISEIKKPTPIFKKPEITRLDNGSCKIHGMPLTVYGKCLVKGCKNG